MKQLKALLTTIPSDSHNWNLIYMELLLQELGYEVYNLGACVPYELSVSACKKLQPDVVVVSTVNGHGYIEGATLIKSLRKEVPKTLPIYVGGKLSTDTNLSVLYASQLEALGFTKAYIENNKLQDFKEKLANIKHESLINVVMQQA